MFGAESVLASRCASQAVFDRFAAMIADFRDYYARNGQPVYENPSPGNKAGGITTLEEKSLGCVQKGGSAPVLDVLPYGAQPHAFSPGGLTLLAGPGNDLVSSTALAAAGCHIVLFTTGRGTPLGTVVPTFKIASNTALAAAKPHWIDWDAERRPDARAFARAVYAAASGAPVCNERAGIHDIDVFKNGITL